MLCITLVIVFIFLIFAIFITVIFSEACVKKSAHRGRGVCAIACWDTHPLGPEADPPGAADNPPYPVQSMLGYTGNKAGGMYPTGMHTCSTLFQEHIDVCALRSPE